MLKNFLSVNNEISSTRPLLSKREELINLPEDVLEKLSIIVQELKSLTKIDSITDKSEKVSKKRTSSEALQQVDSDRPKSDKKKKKRKKEDQ